MRTAHHRSVSSATLPLSRHQERLLAAAVRQLAAAEVGRFPAGQLIAAAARASVRVSRIVASARPDPLTPEEQLALIVRMATLDLDRPRSPEFSSAGS